MSVDNIPDPPTSARRARGGRAAETLLRKITRFQVTRPFVMLGIALVTVLVMGFLAAKLTLKTSFGELLPQNKESVIVAERVAKRLPSQSNIIVVIEGSDNEALKKFVDALGEEIAAIEPALVASVDTGSRDARAFFEKNKFLYAKLEQVQQVHDEIEERYDYEVNKAAGFLLDDDDDAPPPITEETIRKRLDETRGGGSGEKNKKKKRERFPEYYLDTDAHVAAVMVRTPIKSGDIENSHLLKSKLRDAIAAVEKDQGKVGTVGFTGHLITSAETHEQIKNDLSHVGFWGAVLILGIVFLFYLRVRTLLAMTLTVGIGAVWTFGLAWLLIGHLNNSTGFLFSIVVGNGINFGIIYMARYLEARRSSNVEDSAYTAYIDTWISTLTAAGAATAAYGSLVVTDFRGFKHFGIIGGSGMLLCWVATYTFLPSILAVSEKIAPIKPPTGFIARVRGIYGRPFAWLASKYSRSVTIGCVMFTVLCAVAAVGFAADPMEYNMTNIRNRSTGSDSDARVLGRKANKIIGRQGQDGLAIVTDQLEQVIPLAEALHKVRDAAAPGHKPFDKVVTIYSTLPTKQTEKIELIGATLKKLRKARKRKFINDEDWAKLSQHLPEGELAPIGIDNLPQQIKRSFIEKDGTLGRLVYIVPTKDRSVWDGRYLIEFADSFRQTKLPDGSVVKGSGNQVIYADMIINVVEDAPVAIAVSLIATLFIILVAFRLRRSGLWVVASVALGFLWMIAVLAAWNTDWSTLGSDSFELRALKLNFLNFVALPITIGVGADYAVNVMQRYRMVKGDGDASAAGVRRVVVETGGAVILCSLTTTLGYSALTLSVNKAIRSFGIAAAAGEICCVISGVLLLPAVLIWLARRREAAA